MSAPRVRTVVKNKDKSASWYIEVVAPDGCRVYDGWWDKPQREGRIATQREAIIEALIGSVLWNNK